jgi:hypothetical protein
VEKGPGRAGRAGHDRPRRLLREAQDAGVTLAAEGGQVRVSAAEAPSPELLARLRVHKAELLGLLTGDVCRRCGRRMGWPDPRGVVYADGTVEHHACRLRAAAERALPSPDAVADEAEVMLHGEPLP